MWAPVPRQAWLLLGSLVQMGRATLGQGPLKSPLWKSAGQPRMGFCSGPETKGEDACLSVGGELLGTAHLLRAGEHSCQGPPRMKKKTSLAPGATPVKHPSGRALSC